MTRFDPPNPMKPRQHYRIERSGQYSAAFPALPTQLFIKLYESSVRGTEFDVRLVQSTLSHNGKDLAGQPYTMFPACIERPVAQWPRDAGHRVTCEGIAILPAPQLNEMHRRPRFDSLLRFIRVRDRGLIRCMPGVHPADVIAQVALAWPRHTVLVCVTRRRDAHDLRARLAKVFPKSIFTPMNGQHDIRVMVSLYASLGQGPVAIERRKIVIALNPAEMVQNEYGRMALGQMHVGRLYGLVLTDWQPSPYERDLVMAYFGDRDVVLARNGSSPGNCSAVFVRICGGEKLPREIGVLDLKRRGVWHHAVRNRRLARLARAVACVDHEELGEYPELVEQLAQRQVHRIAVVVENIEHALEIGEHLPDWPIVGGPTIFVGGLSAAAQDRLHQGAVVQPADAYKVIVTDSALCDVPRLDVMILASANPLIDIVNQRPFRRLLIVDSHDEHHPVLSARSDERRQLYLGAGWSVEDAGSETLITRCTAPSHRRSRPDV